ncbi:MAG: methyltransferase domain-containing protein [Gammaproteobacteria bacterium]|nr:methyltransferase domain-containing protein [Gammaproteobacteria bacterium]
MTRKSVGQTLLEEAYKLSTPDDNAEYYNEFASTYDLEFADELGWYYPAAIAEIYCDARTTTDSPIADIGCGTGLVARALDLPREQIDGIDISTEMLRISEEKQLYRMLYQVDLTKSLTSIENDYGAVLSAGTFTSGHLGPEPLKALLEIARADALFVIGVKKAFYQEAGFEAVLRDLVASERIKDLKVAEVPMYAKKGHDHSTDTAFALVYRKS